MARRAGVRTRDRITSEAPPTMWYGQNLLYPVLLARVLSRSREKLPFEAPQVGLPVECRTRVELSDHHLAWDGGQFRMGLGDGHSRNIPHLPDNERGNEPSQAYRQDLPQHDDATYVNLRTTQGHPAWIRSVCDQCSPWGGVRVVVGERNKPLTWRRRTVRDSAVKCELRRREDV